MIKGSVYDKFITMRNRYLYLYLYIYTYLNNKALKYLKQKLRELKGEIDNSTIVVGDFNTPHSIMDRTTG